MYVQLLSIQFYQPWTRSPRKFVGVLKDKLNFLEKSPNEDWVNKITASESFSKFVQTFGLIYLRNYVLRGSENTSDSILGSAHIIPLNTMILSRHSRRDRKESANHWFEIYQCISIAGSLSPFAFLEIWVQLFVTEFCLRKLNTAQLPVTQLQLLCQVQRSHTLLLPSLLQGSQQVGKLHPMPFTLTLGLVHSKRERERNF